MALSLVFDGLTAYPDTIVLLTPAVVAIPPRRREVGLEPTVVPSIFLVISMEESLFLLEDSLWEDVWVFSVKSIALSLVFDGLIAYPDTMVPLTPAVVAIPPKKREVGLEPTSVPSIFLVISMEESLFLLEDGLWEDGLREGPAIGEEMGTRSRLKREDGSSETSFPKKLLIVVISWDVLVLTFLETCEGESTESTRGSSFRLVRHILSWGNLQEIHISCGWENRTWWRCCILWGWYRDAFNN